MKKVDAALARLRAPKDVAPDADPTIYAQLAKVAQRMTAGVHQPDSFNALVAAAILDLDARTKGGR